MTRASGDIPMIALDIINPMRNDHPGGQARKVMIKGFPRCLGIEGPGAVEIANQFFFFVSTLTIGFPWLV
jgi:hypothetical protein